MAGLKEDDVAIQEEIISVEGCPTHVLKSGPKPKNIVILIIPGNPGVATYYEEFMRELVSVSDSSLPVWCISHAGHVTLPKPHNINDKSTCFLDLQGQIKHKVTFVRTCVPSDCKLILVGHSIGAYIILHMLKQLPNDTVMKCLLLFPTIERMAMTEKGKYTTPTLKYLRWLAPLGIYPASFLPECVVDMVLRWYFKGRDIPDCAVQATKKLVSPGPIRVVTNMAHEEMQNVIYAEYQLVEKYLDKLMFYYGSCDHWCPVEYYEDMKSKFPNGDINLCNQGYDHAFVLEGSKGVAQIAWTSISQMHLK